MVLLTCEWFKLIRGAFLRFKLVEWVGGWRDPPWPNLAETWKDQRSVFASIHVEHLVKSIFSKRSRCLGRKIQYRCVRKVLLISCTLTSQLQHENEVWNSPPFLDTESSPAQRNERLYFICTPKFFFPAWTRGFTEAGHFFFTAETSNSFA